MRILENEGVAALNTNHIAEIAGVGIASVYQYFPNKDAILAAVYDELLQQERTALEQAADYQSRLSNREMFEYQIDRGIDLRRRLLRIAPEFYQKYIREFALSAQYGGPGRNDIGPSLEATQILFSRLGGDLRVPSNLLTQYIFARGIGAIIDRAAEDNPDLLERGEFRRMLKEMALRFFLQPELLD